jgi:hypothetical protein
MREIYYNSDITPQADNEIKLLTLYYDKINVVNDAVYSPKFKTTNGKFEFDGSEALEFISKTFRKDYKLLIDENIISITKRDEDEKDEYEKKFSKKISDLVNFNHDLIFPVHPTENGGSIITEEVYDIMKSMVDFEWGKPVDRDFIWWYYTFKTKWSLKILMEGGNCVSSSNNLNSLFSQLVKELKISNKNLGTKGYNKSLALDALKLSLPNPDDLSLEDILELKHRLRDELALFSQTINSIEVKSKQLFDQDIKENEYEAVFFNEIQKPLTDLEIKMKNLKSRTFRKFIEKMQNPKSYVPLIGTVAASLPLEYTLLTSLGMATTQSFLEFKEEKQELKNNGLYFLLKIK